MSATCILGSVKCGRLSCDLTYLVYLAIRPIAYHLNQLKYPGRVLGRMRERRGKWERNRKGNIARVKSIESKVREIVYTCMLKKLP